MATTWDTIFRRRLSRGEDHGYAAYAADQWERRQKAKKKREAEVALKQCAERSAYREVYRELLNWCDAVDDDIKKMAGHNADNPVCRGRAFENKRLRRYFGDWLKERIQNSTPK